MNNGKVTIPGSPKYLKEIAVNPKATDVINRNDARPVSIFHVNNQRNLLNNHTLRKPSLRYNCVASLVSTFDIYGVSNVILDAAVYTKIRHLI
ncbi:hypothetical protein FBZ98_11237 [Rhizobium sp. ERR 922]|nr:hypothetical protein FBZ98_11237 [Rhizobium sp. ERR 922]TWB88756.1 hypothetical protein FBZ97_11237 [Rhizobium sp. ERR 942]